MNAFDLSAIPDVIYRLQLSNWLGFGQAAKLVDYLDGLGISHCYTSPYLKARKGSPHGYDVVDHHALNPEFGTRGDFDNFIDQLQRHRMGHILDFVPNHMGVMGSDNAWWLDVLENGPASLFADFFDIDWQPLKAELQGKVLLPILGDYYGNVLENGELNLHFDAGQGEFFVSYYEHRFPVDPREYPRLLNFRHDILLERLGKENRVVQEFEEVSAAFANLPHRYGATEETRLQRRNETQDLKKTLQGLCERYSSILDLILENVAVFNGRNGDVESFDYLHYLLEAQVYRLAFWKVAGDEINYRRFFDINSLAGIRVENPRVFEMTHAYIFELIAMRKIQGLRIDHIDGLNDPLQYLERLHQRLRDLLAADDTSATPFYVVVEKILAVHEHLDESWPVAGTTGYEFAALVNGLFIRAENQKPLANFYHRFIGIRQDFDEIVYRCKQYIVSIPLGSELKVLANQLSRIAEYDRKSRDYTFNELYYALKVIVACFPVYRTYIANGKISRTDCDHIEWAVSEARKRSMADDRTIFDFIRRILLQEFEADTPEAYRKMAVLFTQKLQQYTAPVMAKGYEDTALYKFCLLVSLNDVGSNPRQFGSSVQRFHQLNRERQQHWPHTLLNLSTHDSKRSGDARARINVLSEIPEDWQAAVKFWSHINRAKKKKIAGKLTPSRNDEYLFYQTLVGTWPLDMSGAEVQRAYRERIQAYMLKAVREAKFNSSWGNPDAEYETAMAKFIAKALEPSSDNTFLQAFSKFQAGIVHAGLLNCLSQQQLLLTVPGVPDIYQGTELWSFYLVDPDSRQAVDFNLRLKLLGELQRNFQLVDERARERLKQLTDAPSDGRIKLYLIWQTLQFRRKNALLFKQGHYLPLAIKGRLADHLVAFARIFQEQQVCVVVPRLQARQNTAGRLFPLAGFWAGTWVQAPLPEPAFFRNVLTGEIVASRYQNAECWFEAGEVLSLFPTAVLSAIH